MASSRSGLSERELGESFGVEDFSEIGEREGENTADNRQEAHDVSETRLTILEKLDCSLDSDTISDLVHETIEPVDKG